MMRYKKVELPSSGVKTAKKPVEGKMLEYEIEAMMHNREPIRGTTDVIFTRKRDGVLPAYNPRTDKFDQMITAASEIAKAAETKRDDLRKEQTEPTEPTKTTETSE